MEKRKKKTLYDFQEMKNNGEKITYITAYTAPLAKFAEEAGIDLILVGDSGEMCEGGYKTTVFIPDDLDIMDIMIWMSGSVRRGAHNTFKIDDMPFLSYQVSVSEAIRNAGRFFQKAGADAVKLEGGKRVVDKVKGIVDAGMAAMGHIGLTPQSSNVKRKSPMVNGRTAKEARELINDALALQEAGVFAILVEAVPPEVGKVITEACEVPVLGIGAGPHTDGQLLISHDILGLFTAFNPKFVKKYLDGHRLIVEALKRYVADIRERKFPEKKHCYGMMGGEAKKLIEIIEDVPLPPRKKKAIIEGLKKII